VEEQPVAPFVAETDREAERVAIELFGPRQLFDANSYFVETAYR
jgi:hypothetical protein